MWSLRQIFKSKLWSNIWNQFVLYGFSSIVPFLLIPFLLNRLGVEKYGLVNFALAFTFYFQVINEFGFDLSNVRHVVEHRNDSKELGKILSAILECKGISMLCTLCIYIVAILFIPFLREELMLYILALVRLLGIIIAPYWLFRSMEDIKYITRINIPIKLLCILPVFLVVKRPDDYMLVMLCFALETFVSGITSLYVAKKRYKLRLRPVSSSDIKYYFKDSLPFFSSTFLMRIYKNSNAVLLGFFCGDYAVGIYTAAEKLHNAYISFVSPLLSHIFYPYFTRIKNIKLTIQIIIALCITNLLFLILIYILSPFLIPLFIKTEVASIIMYFNIFLLLLAISVPADMIGFPYLGVLGKIKEVNQTTIYSTITYIIGIVLLAMFDLIDISNVIWTLVAANSVCLIARIYHIRHEKYDSDNL